MLFTSLLEYGNATTNIATGTTFQNWGQIQRNICHANTTVFTIRQKYNNKQTLQSRRTCQNYEANVKYLQKILILGNA